MKRKPKSGIDKVEEFIGEAAVEKSNAETEQELADYKEKTKKKHKDEKKRKQKGEKDTMAEVVIDEQIIKRSLFADNFKRQTFYIHKELIKAIKKCADKGGKGEKTRIINLAIKKYLEGEAAKE
jgi:hypothetical protein